MVSYEAYFYNVYTKKTMQLSKLKWGHFLANMQENDLSNVTAQQQRSQ